MALASASPSEPGSRPHNGSDFPSVSISLSLSLNLGPLICLNLSLGLSLYLPITPADFFIILPGPPGRVRPSLAPLQWVRPENIVLRRIPNPLTNLPTKSVVTRLHQRRIYWVK